MGNKCLRASPDDSMDLRGENKVWHRRVRSNNIPQTNSETVQALQLINKESFITSLEQNSSRRPSSGVSSDYYGSGRNSTELAPTLRHVRSLSKGSTVGLGFPSTEQLFYNAQRDYVEQFVLGMDPRK